MTHQRKRMKLKHDDTKKFLMDNTQLTKASPEDYVSVRDTVFFQNPATHKFESDGTNLPQKYITFMNKFNFPMKLKLFWLILGNVNDEIKTPEFTIMDLKKIESQKDTYSGFIDIGVRYAGMGHVIVLSLDMESGKLFLRMDGGSNGFDREDNWRFYQNKKPSVDFKKNLFTMDVVLDIIKDFNSSDIPIVRGF